MDGIDATALAVANPVLARDLHASLPELEALTVGYMLAMAMALVPAGALADRIGHRRVFLAGLSGFVLSSLLVGLSGSVWPIIALRVLQGTSGAMLAASSLALLRHAFPPERLKVAIGLWSSGLAQPTAVEVAISAAPPEIAGRVAGLQQTVLMISGSLGAAIFGSIIATSAPEFAGHAVAVNAGRYLAGFGHATLLGAALTFLAALAAAAAFRTVRVLPDHRVAQAID